MKFNFETIKDPVISDTNKHIVTGTFADGATVEVSRYLQGWDVRLKIVVNGFVYHDAEIERDEKGQVDRLRGRAMEHQSKLTDERRDSAMVIAKGWLLDQHA